MLYAGTKLPILPMTKETILITIDTDVSVKAPCRISITYYALIKQKTTNFTRAGLRLIGSNRWNILLSCEASNRNDLVKKKLLGFFYCFHVLIAMGSG